MSEKLNEKKFTCIMCPLGCEVTVKTDDKGQITEVTGNDCKKGEPYVRDEFTRPMRVLTSTVAVEGGLVSRLPVRTSGPVPKDKIMECMRSIGNTRLKAPVKLGDVAIKNILGLGVDVVATRDIN